MSNVQYRVHKSTSLTPLSCSKLVQFASSNWSWDSSVGKATVRVRIPVTERYFIHLKTVQTGSGAHRASCLMGTGGKASGDDVNHSPPSRAKFRNDWRYTSTPYMPLWRGQGQLYILPVHPHTHITHYFKWFKCVTMKTWR
jgi:hypothetical protein